MYSLICFFIIIPMLLNSKTSAVHQPDVNGFNCHQCVPEDGFKVPGACDGQKSVIAGQCPPDRQFCATRAYGPDYLSVVGCAAASDKVCSITFSKKNTYDLSCVCAGEVCNMPYTQPLLNALISFTAKVPKNITNPTDVFFHHFYPINGTGMTVYREITVGPRSPVGARMHVLSEPIEERSKIPYYQAMKQDASDPTSDDEDDSEGSGASEDPRDPPVTLDEGPPPSAFSPANENSSPALLFNGLSITPLIFYYFL